MISMSPKSKIKCGQLPTRVYPLLRRDHQYQGCNAGGTVAAIIHCAEDHVVKNGCGTAVAPVDTGKISKDGHDL